MTFSLPHPSERATGVKTDGVGQKTTAHLNLTTPLGEADLKTHKGQVRHAAEVKVRLGILPPPKTIVRRYRQRDLVDLGFTEPPRYPAPTVLPDPVMPTWKRIVYEVCQKRGLRITDILSIRRDRASVAARHEAMWRMRNETTMSLPAIGRRLGGRDHTTVLHGINKYQRGMAQG